MAIFMWIANDENLQSIEYDEKEAAGCSRYSLFSQIKFLIFIILTFFKQKKEREEGCG